MGADRNNDEGKPLLTQPSIATAMILIGLILLVVGLLVVNPMVTGFAGGAAGVGLGGLYCSLHQSRKG